MQHFPTNIPQRLIEDLYSLGALKFGNFTLKSGISSPFYVDLRLSISSPKLLQAISQAIRDTTENCSYDLLCGVPYTALPFATVFSMTHEIPMVLKRKEKKDYGTGKWIEGIFQKGQRCLVIEDVITSGQSILETIGALENEGLIVEDIAVLVDRQQGGRQLLEKKGFRLHSVLTIDIMAQTLANMGKIDASILSSIQKFISEHQVQ